MNTNEINRGWLKLVAGEARGLEWVHIKVRHPETHQTRFDERLALLAGDRKVTVLDSDNPDSRVIGVSLDLNDLRCEVTGRLNSAQHFLRRLLRLRFKAEIGAYFEILKDLQTQNLLNLEEQHFEPNVPDSGDFKIKTRHGYLVVARDVTHGTGVVFTLVRAPEQHPLNACVSRSVVVLYAGGNAPKKLAVGSPAALLVEELNKLVVPTAARQPVTVW